MTRVRRLLFMRGRRRRAGRMARDVKGRLFNVAALISALLLAWACWAWVRSYQPRHLAVEVSKGRVYLIFWERTGRPLTEGLGPGAAYGEPANQLWESLIHPERDGGWQWMGFAFKEGRTRSIPLVRMIAIPCWFLVMLAAVIPATWVAFTLRQRQRAAEQ